MMMMQKKRKPKAKKEQLSDRESQDEEEKQDLINQVKLVPEMIEPLQFSVEAPSIAVDRTVVLEESLQR